MDPTFCVRPARPGDAARLQSVEVAAGAAFADVGHPDVADDEPFPREDLEAYANAGRGWVVADENDRPVGYVVVDIVDGCAHVEQVTVHPDQQGMGLSRLLVDEVERFAKRQGLPALTLTTFADVPWNGPLYAHLGFVVLADHELGPGLRSVRLEEAAHGLDPDQRVCMRRVIRRER